MMKVFIALDLYDNMVRVAETVELAETWLWKRAESTWGERALEHAAWKDAGKDTRDLIRENDGYRWPYRVITQQMLMKPIPINVSMLTEAMSSFTTSESEPVDTIVRGTD